LTGVTESISKHKSLHNKVIKESKQEEEGRENTNDYIRSNERTITLMIINNGDCANH
jgi:hypothetical protein